MTVDYKLFTPKQPLPPNTLWVSEQIPGFHHADDQTMVLQRGHWPSYNVPFYADIYNKSGYPAVVKQFGAQESYQLAPRAPIFRAYADGHVHDLASMRTFMRLNAVQAFLNEVDKASHTANQSEVATALAHPPRSRPNLVETRRYSGRLQTGCIGGCF